MIVEVMSSGYLCNMLQKTKKHAFDNNLPMDSLFHETEFLQFAYDIASGMAHLGSHNVSF